MNSLPVKVSYKTREGSQFYEATVRIPGIRPTKLVRRSDGSTQFPTRSAVLTSARSLARRLGFVDGVDTGYCSGTVTKTATKTATKVATKTATKKRKRTTVTAK